MNKPNTQVASCETTHTPGPWKALGTNLSNAGDIWTVIQMPKLAFDVTSPPSMPTDEHKANARLIAAAPDLLSACKVAHANLKNLYSSEHLVIKSLVNALEKAGAL